eukprot:293850-Chlamydomonas_euryale.AAC.1
MAALTFKPSIRSLLTDCECVAWAHHSPLYRRAAGDGWVEWRRREGGNGERSNMRPPRHTMSKSSHREDGHRAFNHQHDMRPPRHTMSKSSHREDGHRALDRQHVASLVHLELAAVLHRERGAGRQQRIAAHALTEGGLLRVQL